MGTALPACSPGTKFQAFAESVGPRCTPTSGSLPRGLRPGGRGSSLPPTALVSTPLPDLRESGNCGSAGAPQGEKTGGCRQGAGLLGAEAQTLTRFPRGSCRLGLCLQSTSGFFAATSQVSLALGELGAAVQRSLPTSEVTPPPQHPGSGPGLRGDTPAISQVGLRALRDDGPWCITWQQRDRGCLAFTTTGEAGSVGRPWGWGSRQEPPHLSQSNCPQELGCWLLGHRLPTSTHLPHEGREPTGRRDPPPAHSGSVRHTLLFPFYRRNNRGSLT